MSILTKDLRDTTLGGLIFHVLVPLSLVTLGIGGLISARAPVTGTSAVLYGAGFILLGLSSLKLKARPVGNDDSLRLCGTIAGYLLIVGGMISML